jgi:mRNA-degrading endonuclease RelE of RelBE toxin-antitoxin system
MRKILFSKKFAKLITAFPEIDQDLIFSEIEKIERGDKNIDIVKIACKDNLYRIRKGNYRIFFSIENNKICINSVEHRKDAYR